MLRLLEIVAGRPWAVEASIAAHVRELLSAEGLAGLRHLAELKSRVHEYDDAARQAPELRVLQGQGGPAPWAVPEGIHIQPDRLALTEAGAFAARGPQGPTAQALVGVVPMVGMLTQRRQAVGSAETRSTAELAGEVRAMVANPSVDAVLLEVDSPGGEVYGLPEAWAAIREAARQKPVVAVANSVTASAALHIASAATELWVTPSGSVGSVGVYSLHVDLSKAIAEAGEAWTFIVARKSPYKVEGSGAGPLTAGALAHAQAEVDRYMGAFVRDLARGRGVSEARVERDFGGGRMLGADEAVAVGMADTVGTVDQALRRAAQLGKRALEGGASSRSRAESSAAELAARAALAGLPRERR